MEALPTCRPAPSRRANPKHRCWLSGDRAIKGGRRPARHLLDTVRNAHALQGADLVATRSRAPSGGEDMPAWRRGKVWGAEGLSSSVTLYGAVSTPNEATPEILNVRQPLEQVTCAREYW